MFYHHHHPSLANHLISLTEAVTEFHKNSKPYLKPLNYRLQNSKTGYKLVTYIITAAINTTQQSHTTKSNHFPLISTLYQLVNRSRSKNLTYRYLIRTKPCILSKLQLPSKVCTNQLNQCNKHTIYYYYHNRITKTNKLKLMDIEFVTSFNNGTAFFAFLSTLLRLATIFFENSDTSQSIRH